MRPYTNSLCVLVLTPVGRDGSASVEVIRRAGVDAEACASLAELMSGLEDGAGAVLLAEEALFGKPLGELAAWVDQQPPWSDLPFILLASRQQQPAIVSWRQRLMGMLRNVTLLDRPVRKISLASSVQSAVRARRRQYEVRMHLAEGEKTALALEVLVATRTAELERANIELHRQIADRENVEAALRQSQKMEVLGQLTGGIAHDFNNLLQAIGGGLELMTRRVEQGQITEAGRYAEHMRKNVERAATLTNHLLAYARRQTLQPQPVDPRGLVADMKELVRRAVGPTIMVEMHLRRGIWTTLCDPNQLENALLNLAINARDAMPEGGTLSFSTKDVCLSQADAFGQEGAKEGRYVEISVTDTGIGMDQATQRQAFEPFFTTKPIGQGTGLGLSQAYGFVRQSGGFVRLESEPGHGTTVRLFLPRLEQANATPRRLCEPVEAKRAASNAVVLLVEDESEVRVIAAEWLREVGYQVLEAKDGPAALHLLAGTARVDLLVTDVGLPNGLDGRQVADAARQRRSGLPVLFITGYTGSASMEHLEPGMQVIGKPFPLGVLTARIGDMLAKEVEVPAL
jgi:signal transduction histidine kinase/CheY-like chemotaxis protein